MPETYFGPTRRYVRRKTQEGGSPFQHLPYISDRIRDTIVDLTDESYILLPGDKINAQSAPDMPILTIEELAMVYAREDALRDIIKEPQVVFKVKGNAFETERITAMVRGRAPVGDPEQEYYITSEPMEYFDEDDISLVIVLTKDIQKFFVGAGYVDMLKEAVEAIRKIGYSADAI
jgi:hypothetical protein